jgi:acetyltransferase-like isoleucine patch superfamily enzyme
MKKIINLLIIFLPWTIRRYILNKFYHYKIHPTARIGLSYIYPKQLIMGEGARIGHLNVAIHLELIQMDKNCSISQKNWITGFPLSNKSNFQDFPDRKPYLIMKEDSSITKQHHIDCTDMVIVGELTTIAGYGTQILSHSFSLEKNSQACAPIQIGHHCWVGTRSIILPGSVLPSQSVLGAGAVLQKKYTESFVLYGGVPAKYIKKMDETYEFFHRTYRPK